MNIAVIFAGGTGKRMNSNSKPKQFLELYGKPILVYTIEQFQNHKEIDQIVVVCLEAWIDHCKGLCEKYHLTKVADIVKGGENGQESIFNGLAAANRIVDEAAVVLIHDGVRPLIDQDTISACIASVQEHGSAITVAPAIETITIGNHHSKIEQIIDRSAVRVARAPQCFWLRDIYGAHQKAIQEKKNDFIDSASIMMHYGHELYTVDGPMENVKITTSSDFYIFRAIVDERENSQI